MYFLQHRYRRIVLFASIGTWLIMALYQRSAPNQPLLASHVYAQHALQAATAEVTATVSIAVSTTMTVSETIIVTPTATATPIPTNTTPPTPTATWTAIWVTPTPAAADLFAAATLSAQMTVDATTTGTATPLPVNWKVAVVRVLPYVPEPENQATADALAAEATARAITTGEPAGVIYWTATPRPTNTPVATVTPTYTPIVITATATPENVLIAATLAAQATVDATTTGTATPLPKGVVLATNTPKPVIVTNTATPENAATAAVMIAQETAIAFTTGTPNPERYITATPTNTTVPVAVVRPANTAAATTRPTNTATPLFIALDALTATPTPNATPLFPANFVGKIFFLADMDGRSGPEAYVMEPDGSNVVRLTGMEFYQRAAKRDAASADLRYAAFVRKEMSGSRERQIFANDTFYNSEDQLTYFGAGIAWDPAWSPTAERVAFVSNESGNDEIWVANKGEWPATQLTNNEWAWDKHPSWSPDGAQIVFMSNRNGNQQIWLMQGDGIDQRQLSNFAFEAWDPIWVKYTDQ